MESFLGAIDEEEGWRCFTDPREGRCFAPAIWLILVKSFQPEDVGTVIGAFNGQVICVCEVEQAIQINHGLNITRNCLSFILILEQLISVRGANKRRELST